MKQHIHIDAETERPKIVQVSRLPGAIVGICMAMTFGYILLMQYSS
jgi:hypothetical protein